MPFSGASYDPESLDLLTQAFEAAWREVQAANPNQTEADLAITRKMMALRIMAAANEGERDPERLKNLALRAVDRCEFD
jgi:hypothetical protein